MTISTSTTRRMTINKVVLRAGQMAGIWDAEQPMTGAKWTQTSSMARDFLQAIVDALTAQGVMARFVEFYTVQMVVGTFSYTLPSSVLDLVGDGAYLPAGTDTTVVVVNGETIVTSIPREKWQRLSAKDADGNPTLYYPHKANDNLIAYVWPTPSEAGRVRFQALKHIADTNDGNATLDLQIEWWEHIMDKLAYSLAKSSSMPMEDKAVLRSDAGLTRDQAKSSSFQRQPNQFVLRHRTGWSR